MNFTCPNCGENRLQEVSTNCIIVQEILEIGEPGEFDYGNQETFYGENLPYFECAECNWVLPEIDSDEKLLEWLEENC